MVSYAPVITAVHPLAGTAHSASFFPLMMNGIMPIITSSLQVACQESEKERIGNHYCNNRGLDEWGKRREE
ncbi:MAG: hypothetical protein U5R49_01825 [Deltaproteobacteria bacterium]|nr:hypothetical protein [Deltaproteobacteria bacterium]